MSSSVKKRGIAALNQNFPVIIPFFLISLTAYALGESGMLGDFGYKYAHALHDESLHYILMLGGLWFFFFRLGAEIEIANVLKAGPLVIGATLGGVLVPMLFTTSLVYVIGGVTAVSIALYASAGAMATDVPMALGSAKSVEKVIAPTMLTALMILAVGDDVIAVVAMTGMFAESLYQFDALAWEALILLICWLIGKRGDITVKKMDGDEVVRKEIYDITCESRILWVVIVVLNTYFLGRNGIEPILGGCLPMIFAPSSVKHWVEEKTEAISLWMLALFAMVAGAVDIMSADAWGVFTLLALVGGFFGKVLGIFAGGYIGRRQADPNGEYGVKQFHWTSLLAMGIAGGCNGTVAIIFVSVAESKGLIPSDMAGQMKLGFLLTVPLSYVCNIILARLKIQTQAQEAYAR